MFTPLDQYGATYSICVRSILDETWIRALQLRGIATHRHYDVPPRTYLVIQLADQAELLGLVCRLHDMGLTVLSLEVNPTKDELK